MSIVGPTIVFIVEYADWYLYFEHLVQFHKWYA